MIHIIFHAIKKYLQLVSTFPDIINVADGDYLTDLHLLFVLED